MYNGITFYFVAIKTVGYRERDEYEPIEGPFIKREAAFEALRANDGAVIFESWQSNTLVVVETEVITDGFGEVSAP